MDAPVIDWVRINNDDFTSVFNTENEYVAASSSPELDGSGGISGTEKELLLAILNKEQYEQDVR